MYRKVKSYYEIDFRVMASPCFPSVRLRTDANGTYAEVFVDAIIELTKVGVNFQIMIYGSSFF